MSSSEAVSHPELSGSPGQMVPQRLSPSLIDLQHLSDEERSIIISVLERDEQLRQHDQERIKTLKTELHDLRKKGAVNAADENDNSRVCIRCRQPLGLVFNSGDSCPKCQHKVCKACQVTLPSGTRWLCTVCHKNMQLQLETGEWHFSQLQVDQVPLFGSDLVKASLAKAKHSLTDPSTVPVLTASDLRSDSHSSLPGKKRSDPGKARHHKGRPGSQTSSDYNPSGQTSRRSASSGSEPLSVTDSSEVDGVVEPISGFTFHRVSFRRDRKGSGKQDSTGDTTNQASPSLANKGASIFWDSRREDCMYGGQTGTSSPSDSSTSSPWEVVSVCTLEVGDNKQSSGTSAFSIPQDSMDVRQGSDLTVDNCTQTIPAENMAIGQAACLLQDQSADSTHVDRTAPIDLNEYYLDMLEGTQHNETGFLLKDEHSSDSVIQHQIIRPQPARGAIASCRSQSPKPALSISPNSAFTPVNEVREAPEGRESTYTELVSMETHVPAHIDIAYSLNSVYLGHEMSVVNPSQQEWQDLNKNCWEEDVFSPAVLDLRPRTSSSISQASSSSSNQHPTEKDKKPPMKRPSETDYSSSDSCTTPSDESDSLCELELDWDLRASSPDFQEVQLQSKLKKNQDLMRELMMEAHRNTPEFFHKTASVSPDSNQMNSKPHAQSRPQPSSRSPTDEFPLQSQDYETELGHNASSGTDDADLSSSVSSWIDSDPSSDDNMPRSLSTFTPASSSIAASASMDKPANVSKPTSKKKVIPRPDWAAMKVQRWKASVPPTSYRMKRPGGRSEAGVSRKPVLMTHKNKGMYVVNPGSDDEDSDSSSDETDSNVKHAKPSHPRRIPGRAGSDHLKYSNCSSSDSELSTILEVSEDDQSGPSPDSTPAKLVAFTMEDVVIPSIVVSGPCGLSSTEEDADDEAENPDLLSPEYEPESKWAESAHTSYV